MKKWFLLLPVLGLLFFAVYCSNGQTNPTQVQRIIIIRHGEKPDQGDNLSCQGLNRALQLADVLNKKIGVPDYVFVPSINTGKKTGTARMYQTIVPFAVKYNLRINTKYDVDDYKGIADDVLKRNGTVLLVWEHKAIDNIVKALGLPHSPKWDDNDFDSIWIITFKDGKPVLSTDKEGINPSATCP